MRIFFPLATERIRKFYENFSKKFQFSMAETKLNGKI